jgi:tRNA(fMet)-specific endonuclease VapC
MIGLDSSAIIDLFKGEDSLKQLLLSIDEPISATEISYLELMFGIDRTIKKHKEEERYYDEFFNKILVLNLSRKSVKSASEIYWSLNKSGKSIEKFDCIIAGIFLSSGVNKIITRNEKHFSRIPGVKVLSY